MDEVKRETNCPQCSRHCPVSELSCNRGRSYFGLPVTAEGGEKRHHKDHGGHHHRGRHED